MGRAGVFGGFSDGGQADCAHALHGEGTRRDVRTLVGDFGTLLRPKLQISGDEKRVRGGTVLDDFDRGAGSGSFWLFWEF